MNKATLLHLVLMLHLCCCLYSLVLIFTFFFLTTGPRGSHRFQSPNQRRPRRRRDQRCIFLHLCACLTEMFASIAVLYNRDNEPPPVWRCKAGKPPPPMPPAPFLTDDNAVTDVVRTGKRTGGCRQDPVGVAGAVFGSAASSSSQKLRVPRKKDLVRANKEAAARVVPLADRPKRVSKTIPRPGSSRSGKPRPNAAARDLGSTARPLPHTGRGMWAGGDRPDGR